MEMGWLSRCCYNILFLQLFILQNSLTYSNPCSHDEASALLHFKQLFTFITNDSYYGFLIENWKEDIDCCIWDGVDCDMHTGHVIGLDLSCSGLNGTIPSNSTLFHLPYLQSLRLSSNNHLKGAFPQANWSNPLEILDVSSTNFSGRLPDSIGSLKSLTQLDLRSCKFIGSIPASLGNLTQLNRLWLSNNNFSGGIPKSFANLTQLSNIDLSMNSLSGHIPSSFSNLPNLIELNLSYNNFTDGIPEIFVNLTQLRFLDLSRNQLSGPIPSRLSGLRNLTFVTLSHNFLNGTIPSSLFTLPSLRRIDFNFNQLEAIDIGDNPSNALESITLDNNRLHFTSLLSIFQLVKLRRISLSSNNLSGSLEPYMFANMTNLSYLDLSNNSLTLSNTIKVKSSFEGPNLTTLILSHNKIRGEIPNWMRNFGKDSLRFLDLSHNFLKSIKQLPWKNLEFLDLRSNLLHGKLPNLPRRLINFFISNNQLTGEIPHWICNNKFAILDLSNNNLSGRIQECMGSISSNYLNVLDLQNNSFSGTIPDTFAECNTLETLNFNNNDLEGLVPRSLVNCRALEVLNLGNNKISDTFPHWLGTFPELQVLVLRCNKFYGSVTSKADNSFTKLRILDLSSNNFSGYLPMRYFKNLKAMMNVDKVGGMVEYMTLGSLYLGNYYQDSIMLTIKGVDIQMEKILTIFTALDLSSNKFEGPMPDAIGYLKTLIVVNFSHNNLIGRIPLSLENMTALESLDFSSNKLEGEIPKQITSLTYLSVLNLSYNHLVGAIPQGKQFGTFQNDCYIGNLGLCDFPLSKKCTNIGDVPNSTIFHEEQDTSSWLDWKVILMGYGSGVVIGLSIGYMVFSIGKPQWIVSMVEREQSRKVVRRLTGKHGRRT